MRAKRRFYLLRFAKLFWMTGCGIFFIISSCREAQADMFCPSPNYPLWACDNGYECGSYYNCVPRYCPYGTKTCGNGCISYEAECCSQYQGTWCDAGYTCNAAGTWCSPVDQIPSISFTGPLPLGGRVTRKFKVTGVVVDDIGIVSVEYAVPGIQGWKRMKGQKGVSRRIGFTLSLKLPRRARGTVQVFIRTTDTAGHSNFAVAEYSVR